MEKLKIVVGGYIGLYPTGGATWDYIQYPLGLKLLGHDIYYVEDTMQYPVFQTEGKAWNDATACVNYLKSVMESIGLAGKWAYRDVASGACYGMSEGEIGRVCKKADVFINISCSTYLRDEYLAIPKRVLIDSDPMFTQVQYSLELQSNTEAADWNTKHMVENHNYLFTFGENIGTSDCRIPEFGFKWHPTRQPVCLQSWEKKEGVHGRSFTSVMNWSGRKKLNYRGEEWGQKDVEFEKIKEVPARLPNAQFTVVINQPLHHDSTFNQHELTGLGWTLLDPQRTVSSALNYHNFIHQSLGEFSVAKETYVKSNSGWFSCRSACYLAAGKPVVTQDTGWSRYIPPGAGLIPFTTAEEAVEGLRQILNEPYRHAKAAAQVAREYFDSSKVLESLLWVVLGSNT